MGPLHLVYQQCMLSLACMFGIGKVSALNVLQKNPLNHLRNLDELPEVIAEEANTTPPLHILTPSYFKTSLVENKCVCASTVCSRIHEKLSFAHEDFHF